MHSLKKPSAMARAYAPAGGCETILNDWCAIHCHNGTQLHARLVSQPCKRAGVAKSICPESAWSCVKYPDGRARSCGDKSHVPHHARMYAVGVIQSAEDAALLAELSMCNATAAGVRTSGVKWNNSNAYWRQANGRPKRVVSTSSKDTGGPSSSGPKAFALQPESCLLDGASTANGEAAFSARCKKASSRAQN